MSESVVVSSGANALWQVHRFSSALLKALEGWAGVGGGGTRLPPPLGRGRLFKNTARQKRGGGGRRNPSDGERGHRRVEGAGEARRSEDVGLERRLVSDNRNLGWNSVLRRHPLRSSVDSSPFLGWREFGCKRGCQN